MAENQIKKLKMIIGEVEGLNLWFKKKEKESFGTYRHTLKKDGEDMYVVAASDVEEFSNWMRDNATDLIGIKCMVRPNGIWFTSEAEEEAKFY